MSTKKVKITSDQFYEWVWPYVRNGAEGVSCMHLVGSGECSAQCMVLQSLYTRHQRIE